MDLNMMCTGPSRPRFLSGSGRPMRFVDVDGGVINVFQRATEAYDDLSIRDRLIADPAAEADATRAVMEQRVSTYFSPQSMLSHPVSFATYSRDYQERCWTAARDLGMPIWSAAEWAAFTKARDATRIVDVSQSDGTVGARVLGSSPTGRLTVMLPLAHVDSAYVDGQPVPATGRRVFGWDYALIPVDTSRGDHHTLEVRTPSPSFTHPTVRQPDVQVALMQTAKGAVVRMAASFAQPHPEGTWHWYIVIGTDGRPEWKRSEKERPKLWFAYAHMREPTEFDGAMNGSTHHRKRGAADTATRTTTPMWRSATPCAASVRSNSTSTAPSIPRLRRSGPRSQSRANTPLDVPDFRPGPHRPKDAQPKTKTPASR